MKLPNSTCLTKTFAVFAAFSLVMCMNLFAGNDDLKNSLIITGGHVVVNDDDVNDNKNWDFTETPTDENPTPDTGLIGPNTQEQSEPKLQKFSFKAIPTHEAGELVIQIPSSEKITLWKDADKKEPFNLKPSYPVSISDKDPVEFYVEGKKATDAFDSITFSASYTVGGKTATGEIKFGVTQADIDLDSNNDAKPSYTAAVGSYDADAIAAEIADDEIEFSRKSEYLGKIIFEKQGDVDSDGIADSVDGLSLPDSPTSNSVAGLQLTPMRVTVQAPFNPATAKVKFTYNASIPRTTIDTDPLNGPGDIAAAGALVGGKQTYIVNKKGLRLWKVDGGARTSGKNVAAEGGGDFIPADKEIAWEDIAPTGATTATIYIEYVDMPGNEKSYKKEDIVLTITDAESAKKGHIKILKNTTELTGKESPDGVVMGILPVEIVDKNFNPLVELKIGKMYPNVIKGTGLGGSVADVKLDADEDRFYVRVKGGVALGTIKMEFETTDNAIPSYNDNATDYTLEVDKGDAITKSMVLVSDDIDDHHEASIYKGMADDSANDRTHKILVGGNFKISTIKVGEGISMPVDIKLPVKNKKTVKVQFVNCTYAFDNFCWDPPTDIIYFQNLMRERYAQVGVEFEFLPVVEGAYIGVSGSLDENEILKFNPSTGKINFPKATKDVIDYNPPKDINNMLMIYLVRGLGIGVGDDDARGLASPENYVNPSDSRYANKVFLSLYDRKDFTAAHEALHVLANAAHHAAPYNDFATEYANENTLWTVPTPENQYPRRDNGSMGSTKRISLPQESAIHASTLAK